MFQIRAGTGRRFTGNGGCSDRNVEPSENACSRLSVPWLPLALLSLCHYFATFPLCPFFLFLSSFFVPPDSHLDLSNGAVRLLGLQTTMEWCGSEFADYCRFPFLHLLTMVRRTSNFILRLRLGTGGALKLKFKEQMKEWKVASCGLSQAL